MGSMSKKHIATCAEVRAYREAHPDAGMHDAKRAVEQLRKDWHDVDDLERALRSLEEKSMTVTVITTYRNVDQEWLDWYLKRLANEQVMPGSTTIAAELRDCGHALFCSKDPDSEVIATTEYRVLEPKRKAARRG